MGSWLRNIQGQLSDLANEVLNEANDVLAEATEEVADPDGEIIVAKKKCAEAEKQLAIESAKVASLNSEKSSLEQQLYDAHVEMDTIGSKLENMVKQRDEEIKKLKTQMERIQESGWSSPSAPSESQNDVIIADSEKMVSEEEMDRRIEELRNQKEHEIQALIDSHAENILEMREMYEEKISAMQVLPYNASSSTSNADTLDAVLLEKDELKESDGEVVDILNSEEELKAHNQELAAAYNELNQEFEEFKERHLATENANSDLNRRIDSLKANLIEYEERYEICKRENAETVAQLEHLSAEFARLRTGVQNVSQRREDCDSMVNEEVEKLKMALDESREERERLRGDVQRFQVAVGEIDVELEKLRELNRTLLGENQALTENLSRYDDTMKSIISDSEQDIGKFQEQFREIQENHKIQRETVQAENEALREESEAIKRQRDIILEESALLKEMNEKLKQKSETEEEKINLLQTKADLLQQVVDELKAKNEKKPEIDDSMTDLDVLRTQLKEALVANAEKTEECEKLQMETRNLEREVELRQNCVDEMIAQTNTLQMQQEQMSSANRVLQNANLAAERRIVALEERVTEGGESVERLMEKVKELEEIIVGNLENETDSPSSSESAEDVRKLRRYIVDLQEKLKIAEDELQLIKDQKLEENEKSAEIRQNLERDLFEAEEVDRGLLEGIEARVQEMESQLLEKMAELESKKSELKIWTEKGEKFEISKTLWDEERQMMTEKIAKLETEKKQIAEQTLSDLAELQTTVAELQKEQNSTAEELDTARSGAAQVEGLKIEISRLQNENEQLRMTSEPSPTPAELVELQATVSELQVAQDLAIRELETARTAAAQSEELKVQISQLQHENEHLKTVAKTHYEENVKYYEQCQMMAQKIQEIESRTLADQENHEKRGKEVQRLREHLMIVEETSTREAVEAEQRETDLRSRIRELEARGHAVESGASESTQQYQVKIADLTAQLESSQNQSIDWKNRLESERKIREETQEALSSLQNVVGELSRDHERDAAAASHRNLDLQSRILTLQEEIAQIREELDRQSIGRQAAEEETDRRNLQLDSKQKIIEDLENQIEELRSPRKPTESYRIDDSTLRQLFLNYFSSEPSKRPDIAMLLASILEYPPEEMDKFKSAVHQSFAQTSSASSFFFGSRGSPAGGGASIADQFIRFLEVESESSRTAPHLPIRAQQNADSMPQMSIDKTPPTGQVSASSSAAALDSILR